MVDREKVLKGLKACSDDRGNCRKCPYCHLKGLTCLVTLTTDALELLQEQEPVEPIKLENWWKCPSCSGNIVYNMKYCAGCGRKVKWDG